MSQQFGIVDPQDDIHAGAAYRRALLGTMVERALRTARVRATHASPA